MIALDGVRGNQKERKARCDGSPAQAASARPARRDRGQAVLECVAVRYSLLSMLLTTLLLDSGCGSDDGGAADAAAGATADASAGGDATPGADAAAGEDLNMQASDFGCILEGTRVRQFFIWNPLGRLDQAVDVAMSPTGGTYPVGTVLQLIPTEAMVKRRQGWNPATNDWEFFSLNVAATETTILARGAADVENAFGGNCLECHSQAEPKWDLVCEDSHGCDPLQIDDTLIEALQNADTRCL